MWERCFKAAIEIICACIPFRKARRSVRSRLMCWKSFFAFNIYARPKIRQLRRSRRCIKVGFLVMYDSCFQMESVFIKMLKSNKFKPDIYVIPDMARGMDYMDKTMAKTLSSLKVKYGELVHSTIINGRFEDISDKFDICTIMNPYASLSHRFYSIRYLTIKGVPVFFSKYYFENGEVWAKTFYALSDLGYLWRFYVENETIKDNVIRRNPWMQNSICITGYPKLDMMKQVAIKSRRERKRVILAPHHSVIKSEEYNIGNFLEYEQFFLTLPKNYPQIDWVFRPHPLLFPNIILNGIWTSEKKEAWLSSLLAYPNVTYQDGGDYYETFMNSDGMIQDCGSFLPEYLCTNKPQCFILRDPTHETKMFPSQWGRLLLKNVYRAYCESDITNFIQDTIIDVRDPMKSQRTGFVKNVLMGNEASPTDCIIRDLELQLAIIE